MKYTTSIKAYASFASLENAISLMKVQLEPLHVAEFII